MEKQPLYLNSEGTPVGWIGYPLIGLKLDEWEPVSVGCVETLDMTGYATWQVVYNASEDTVYCWSIGQEGWPEAQSYDERWPLTIETARTGLGAVLYYIERYGPADPKPAQVKIMCSLGTFVLEKTEGGYQEVTDA